MFDLTKKNTPRFELASKDIHALHEWKHDILSRLKEANSSIDVKKKIEVLSELCFLVSAQMAYDSTKKTQALIVQMKNRYGLTDEEIQKCLSGNNSIRLTSSRQM